MVKKRVRKIVAAGILASMVLEQVTSMAAGTGVMSVKTDAGTEITAAVTLDGGVPSDGQFAVRLEQESFEPAMTDTNTELETVSRYGTVEFTCPDTAAGETDYVYTLSYPDGTGDSGTFSLLPGESRVFDRLEEGTEWEITESGSEKRWYGVSCETLAEEWPEVAVSGPFEELPNADFSEENAAAADPVDIAVRNDAEGNVVFPLGDLADGSYRFRMMQSDTTDETILYDASVYDVAAEVSGGEMSVLYLLDGESVDEAVFHNTTKTDDGLSLTIVMPELDDTDTGFRFDYTVTPPKGEPGSGSFLLRSGEENSVEAGDGSEYTVTLTAPEGWDCARSEWDGIVAGEDVRIEPDIFRENGAASGDSAETGGHASDGTGDAANDPADGRTDTSLGIATPGNATPSEIIYVPEVPGEGTESTENALSAKTVEEAFRLISDNGMVCVTEDIAMDQAVLDDGRNVTIRSYGDKAYTVAKESGGIGENMFSVSGGSRLTLSNIVIDASDNTNGRTVSVTDGSELILSEGSVLENNSAHGAVSLDRADMLISGGSISGNKSNENGGAVLLENGSAFSMGSGNLTGNSAENGGAVYVSGGCTVTITGGAFVENEAEQDGGAVCIEGGTDGITFVFNGAEFRENGTVKGMGGAISVKSNAEAGDKLDITDCVFTGNTGYWSGGALYLEKIVSLVLKDDRFESNSATGEGGAVKFSNTTSVPSDIRIDGCVFTKNKTRAAGGGMRIDMFSGNCDIVGDTVFSYNEAAINCGAIGFYCIGEEGLKREGTQVTVNMESCDVLYNTCTGDMTVYDYMNPDDRDGHDSIVHYNTGGVYIGEYVQLMTGKMLVTKNRVESGYEGNTVANGIGLCPNAEAYIGDNITVCGNGDNPDSMDILAVPNDPCVHREGMPRLVIGETSADGKEYNWTGLDGKEARTGEYNWDNVINGIETVAADDVYQGEDNLDPVGFRANFADAEIMTVDAESDYDVRVIGNMAEIAVFGAGGLMLNGSEVSKGLTIVKETQFQGVWSEEEKNEINNRDFQFTLYILSHNTDFGDVTGVPYTKSGGPTGIEEAGIIDFVKDNERNAHCSFSLKGGQKLFFDDQALSIFGIKVSGNDEFDFYLEETDSKGASDCSVTTHYEVTGYTDDAHNRGPYGTLTITCTNYFKRSTIRVGKNIKSGSDGTEFVFRLNKITDINKDLYKEHGIDQDNYSDVVLDTSLAEGVPYAIFAYDGNQQGNATNINSGEFRLKAGQYAELYLPDNSLWTVSEQDNEKFTLESISEKTDTNKTIIVGNNLMLIDVNFNPDTGFNQNMPPEADPAYPSGPVAILFSNHSLVFTDRDRGIDPAYGIPVERYYDWETTVYNGGVKEMGSNEYSDDVITVNVQTDVPWFGKDIDKVILETEISPLSTAWWFAGDGYSSIEIEGLSRLDISKVTDMSGMFAGRVDVVGIDELFDRDFSKVTNISGMFAGCENLTYFSEFANLDTSNVTNMSYMFAGCDNLTDVNALVGLDTSSVTDMSYMFVGCENLTDVNALVGLDASSVTDMSGMFAGCKNLTDVNALVGLNTDNVTNMSYMFACCYGLTDLSTLAGLDTSSVTDMSYMFAGCKNLTDVNALVGLDTSSVTNMSGMFGTITIMTQYDDAGYIMYSYYHFRCSQLTKVNLDGLDVHNVTDMSDMFAGCENLTDLSSLAGLDTSSVTNMSGMFTLCKNLTDLSALVRLDTSNVTNMSSMFACCENLTDLNTLVGLDTSSVTNMSYMFAGCTSLSDVNALVRLDTSSVTNMSGMFSELMDPGTYNSYDYYYCDQLTEVDLDGLNVSNVTNMDDMFYKCFNLTTLSIADWHPVNLVSAHSMFWYDKNLRYIYSNDWTDIPGVLRSRDVFYWCENLPGYDRTKVGGNMCKSTEQGGYFTDPSLKPNAQANETAESRQNSSILNRGTETPTKQMAEIRQSDLMVISTEPWRDAPDIPFIEFVNNPNSLPLPDSTVTFCIRKNASDNNMEFTFLMNRVTERDAQAYDGSGMLKQEHYGDFVQSSVPWENLQYKLYGSDGSPLEDGQTGMDGTFRMKAGQYAEFTVPAEYMGLISELNNTDFRLQNVSSDSDLFTQLERNSWLFNGRIYSVYADPNGGTSAETGDWKTSSDVDGWLEMKDVKEGAVITIPSAPVWADHEFLGWQVSLGGKTEIYGAESSFTTVKDLNENCDIVFTAVWKNLYAVILDTDGGTVETSEPWIETSSGIWKYGNIAENSDIVLPSVPPAREGYVFKGWQLNGSSDLYEPGNTVNVNQITGNGSYVLTFKAVWKAFSALYLDCVDGTIPDESWSRYDVGNGMYKVSMTQDNYTFDLPTPERGGSEFLYWKLASTGQTANAGESVTVSPDDADSTGATVWVAVWNRSYRVILALDGGIITASEPWIEYETYLASPYLAEGDSITLPNAVPTHDGELVFVGWKDQNKQEHGPGEKITVSEEISADHIVRMTAIWQGPLTVILNPNGGTVDSYVGWTFDKGLLSQTHRVGTSLTLPTPVFEHYTFTGWKIKKTGKVYQPGENFILAAPDSYNGQTIHVIATWETNLKYAVAIYGIKEDVDQNGNPIGLTLGPATDECFLDTYKACGSSREEAPNCFHWMSWEEIIEKAKTDPESFRKCLNNGCTHAVELDSSSIRFLAPYDETNSTFYAGDGVSMFALGSSEFYEHSAWNRENSVAGGYPASQIRAILNGSDEKTDPAVAGNEIISLTAEDALISAFPDELRNEIVPKKVSSGTIKIEDDEVITYDKLWLFSAREIFAGTSSEGSTILRKNEGPNGENKSYSRAIILGIDYNAKENDKLTECMIDPETKRPYGGVMLRSINYTPKPKLYLWDGVGLLDPFSDKGWCINNTLFISMEDWWKIAPGFCIGAAQ